MGPREPKLACEGKGETASKHRPEVQGQTRDRAWPRRETRHRAGVPRARELGSCEHTQETQIDRHKHPETGRAVHSSWSLTGRFCAWLAFSSSSLPPVPGYNRLGFRGSAQRPSPGESSPPRPQRVDRCPAALHPARACPHCWPRQHLPEGFGSPPVTFFIIQIQILRSVFFFSIFNHQRLAYSGVQ